MIENTNVPDVSIVVPCYNEESALELTMPPLCDTFREAGVRLEVILVDNGSIDRTSEVIDRLIARGLPVKKGVVPVNQGQGLGFVTGFKLCNGRFAGNLCADGQVEPEDVLSVYRAVAAAEIPCVGKARRRYRQDSWVRKIVSICYNFLMIVLFPGIHTLDVNGNPKILPTAAMKKMELSSRDWFLEAEIMLKASYLHLPVIEIDVFGQLRQGGKSHVRVSTVVEFIQNIIRCRFGLLWPEWEKANVKG